MNADRVDAFLIANARLLPDDKISSIRQLLLDIDEYKFSLLLSIGFKDPTTALILSIFLGGIGVDRFYIGDIGLGIGKLCTLGGCGIWAFIDLFFIMEATRRKNFEMLYALLK